MASAATSLLRAGWLPQAVTRRRCSHADLDAERLVGHIEDALLDLLVDLFGSVDEGLPRARGWGRGHAAAAYGVAVGRGWRTSSTLAAVLADVSKKTKPCSCANCCPSSEDTARRCLCAKQGRCGRPARTYLPIGRGWPRLVEAGQEAGGRPELDLALAGRA